MLHAGENLHEAAEREVLEETGVRARFAGLLAVRQAHGFAFGKSDLFFCCALVPEPEQHTLTPCVSVLFPAFACLQLPNWGLQTVHVLSAKAQQQQFRLWQHGRRR